MEAKKKVSVSGQAGRGNSKKGRIRPAVNVSAMGGELGWGQWEDWIDGSGIISEEKSRDSILYSVAGALLGFQRRALKTQKRARIREVGHGLVEGILQIDELAKF